MITLIRASFGQRAWPPSTRIVAKLFWPSIEMQVSLAQVVRLSGTNCVCVCVGGGYLGQVKGPWFFARFTDIFFRIRNIRFSCFWRSSKKNFAGQRSKSKGLGEERVLKPFSEDCYVPIWNQGIDPKYERTPLNYPRAPEADGVMNINKKRMFMIFEKRNLLCPQNVFLLAQ